MFHIIASIKLIAILTRLCITYRSNIILKKTSQTDLDKSTYSSPIKLSLLMMNVKIMYLMSVTQNT